MNISAISHNFYSAADPVATSIARSVTVTHIALLALSALTFALGFVATYLYFCRVTQKPDSTFLQKPIENTPAAPNPASVSAPKKPIEDTPVAVSASAPVPKELKATFINTIGNNELISAQAQIAKHLSSLNITLSVTAENEPHDIQFMIIESGNRIVEAVAANITHILERLNSTSAPLIVVFPGDNIARLRYVSSHFHHITEDFRREAEHYNYLYENKSVEELLNFEVAPIYIGTEKNANCHVPGNKVEELKAEFVSAHNDPGKLQKFVAKTLLLANNS